MTAPGWRVPEHRVESTDHIQLQRGLEQPPPLEQWPLDEQRVRELWAEFGTRGAGARVAVIDTGVDAAHPALPGVVEHDCTGAGPGDAGGHGTHVCGIVGGRGAGLSGVAPECELHSFRVFAGETTDDATIIRGLREVASGRHGRFDVVNLSLGSARANDEMRALCLEMSARGTLLVCAAGNSGDHLATEAPRFGTIGFPAEFDSSICVGASDSAGRRSAFSSTGPELHVMAPGQDVLSAWPGDRLAVLSGTSMAAPFVTGLLALMAARCRAQGWAPPNRCEALHCMAASASDMEAAGFDAFTGYGRLFAPGAMRRLVDLKTGSP